MCVGFSCSAIIFSMFWETEAAVHIEMYRLQVYTYYGLHEKVTRSKVYTLITRPRQLQEDIYRVATFWLCGTSAVSACHLGWLLLLCEFLDRFLALCGLGWVVANLFRPTSLFGTTRQWVWSNVLRPLLSGERMQQNKRLCLLTFSFINAKSSKEKINSHKIYIMLSHFSLQKPFRDVHWPQGIQWGKTWLPPGTGKWFWLCSCGEVERSEVTWNCVVVSETLSDCGCLKNHGTIFETKDDKWCAVICMLCFIFRFYMFLFTMHRRFQVCS